MLSETFDFFNAEPDADGAQLHERADNEAYLSRVPGRQYAVYFTDGGSVGLDLTEEPGRFRVRWLDIGTNAWTSDTETNGGTLVQLTAPEQGPWVALDAGLRAIVPCCSRTRDANLTAGC